MWSCEWRMQTQSAVMICPHIRLVNFSNLELLLLTSVRFSQTLFIYLLLLLAFIN